MMAIAKQSRASKGQILSTDLVISLSLFLGALLIFMLAWSSMSYSYWEQKADTDMQSALLSISDSLVYSQGTPSDWEFSSGLNASSFGLAVSRNTISARKIAALQSIFSSNYSLAKERAGAGRFDISVSIKDLSGSQIYGFGSVANFTDRQVSAAGAERLAIMDGKLVKVSVQLWRAKGGALR